MKTFYIRYGIGKAKYVINYYDGIAKHKDGSKFYGIRIFHNKRLLKQCMKLLQAQGYVEE